VLKVGVAAAMAIALTIVLRPVLLGDGLSGLELVAAAGLLVAAGEVLRRQGGFARKLGLLSLVVGAILGAVAMAVLTVAVLWCCP
jgi:hypothetical protein